MQSRKTTKPALAAVATMPSIPKGLIGQFVTGPMSAEVVETIFLAFNKALIERALGAELSHHLGDRPGAHKPADSSNHGNGASGKTRGQPPLMRSAVAAFGFVYIHSLADGNGRVHRLLVNDVPRRDGVVLDPMILPVSSLITSDAAERRAYDRILDVVSRPLTRTLADTYRFAPAPIAYPDGAASNFVFEGAELAHHAWRYLDLSPHVGYMADVVRRTVREDMLEDSRYLRSHGLARAAFKEILEMPDAQIDRVIRSVQNNKGDLSGALSKELPILEEAGLWETIVKAVQGAFEVCPRSAVADTYDGAMKPAR